MDTMQPTPVINHRPWWRTSPGAAAVAVAGVGALAAAALVVGLDSRPDAGETYVAELKAAAPSVITIDEPVVLATATRACGNGDAGTVGLITALSGSGFAPTAIVDKIMPAHARYCDSLN